jgi:hypothetical protein
VALDDEDTQWLAVIGRSLAFLALHAAELRGKEMGDQAVLLSTLGLNNDEIAKLVGSTAESIRVTLGSKRKTKSNGRKRGSKTPGKKRR